MRPTRNRMNDMTFEKADRMAMAKHKKTLTFFKDAQKALEKRGKEDPAFYFEMVVDHLESGGQLDDKVERILGL